MSWISTSAVEELEDEEDDELLVAADPLLAPDEPDPPLLEPPALTLCPTERFTATTVPAMGATRDASARSTCAESSWLCAAAIAAWSESISDKLGVAEAEP